MIVEKGELSGFQNDNLVLAFSTDSNERITFEYSTFHLTDTAKALIEILEIETDDEFFQASPDKFKEYFMRLGLLRIFNVMNVMNILDRFQLFLLNQNM